MTLALVASLVVSMTLASVAGAQPDTTLYQPKGQLSWDYWFARDGATYHAFYLQAPIGTPAMWGSSTVGMATSIDLKRWEEYGEVLGPNPKGQWNDAGIATGSVWRSGDRWQMVFTAIGRDPGIGLARSADLRHWEKVGPVRFHTRPFTVPHSSYWQSHGYAEGRNLSYTILADCYVLPEPVGGYHYMVTNAVIDGEPPDKRGCTALLRTHDGMDWEDCGIVAAPGEYDRLETPQLWRHGKRWYLYFGAARENPVYRANCLFTADQMSGPFLPAPGGGLALPDGQGYYIAKVVKATGGGDVLMACIGPGRLSQPYPITYNRDGSIALAKP